MTYILVVAIKLDIQHSLFTILTDLGWKYCYVILLMDKKQFREVESLGQGHRDKQMVRAEFKSSRCDSNFPRLSFCCAALSTS